MKGNYVMTYSHIFKRLHTAALGRFKCPHSFDLYAIVVGCFDRHMFALVVCTRRTQPTQTELGGGGVSY